MDVVPADMRGELGKAKVLITNFHAFKQRERGDGSRLTKVLSGQAASGVTTESPDQMVRRVLRELGTKKNIVVINDEAHHCYRRKPDGEDEKLTGDERKEAQKREEEARVWISGLEAVKAKVGVKVIYDLSATPFFLRGSGYREGTLFPWVVSDFSLIDAIESGIVKVPRVPVTDNTGDGESPTYRDLWLRIRDDLPKKGRSTETLIDEPKLPADLEGALHSLYGNYKKAYDAWEQDAEARANGRTPPVFIVVCNNTNVSNLVFRYIAGWEKPLEGGETIIVPGRMPIFSNATDDHRWRDRPNTILVDSAQLESGEGMSDEFKKIAVLEIEEFKAEYRARFPGRGSDDLTDEDLLREVMNTVGKAGKLGEQVKCVVSVSMLTEGWDANTVTHVLGVRAFGTQLLCEQVVGRGLRRTSYAADPETGLFSTEYAEVYGVPFSFIPCSGSATKTDTKPVTHVRALEERAALEITFPRVTGYRYDLPAERLIVDSFSQDSRLALSTQDVTTWTELDPIVGEKSIHTLDALKQARPQQVAFVLAKRTLEQFFAEKDADGHTYYKVWLFPDLVDIARRWLDECVTMKDDAFPQMLMLAELSHVGAEHIYQSIVSATPGEKRLMPILRPYDTVGSSRYVSFDTTRATMKTDPAKCHVSHVVADTETWEQKLAQALESMPEVLCYVKNHGLGFTIPYTMAGEQRNYTPDYIVRLYDGHDEPLNLILECSGEARKDKAEKCKTARNLWVPAINNHVGYGRWAFLEITDPWDAAHAISASLASPRVAHVVAEVSI